LEMELRPLSKGNEYLEAVLDTDNLNHSNPFEQTSGAAAKEAGKRPGFPKRFNARGCDGGLRIEQSFYYKKEGRRLFLLPVALAVEPNKVTVKVGPPLLCESNDAFRGCDPRIEQARV